ncbi:MAG TPA: DUF72 domain-containing protein [Pyrinomonadaceae bacterium]|nr:DUF72 domain-containing protein [Pyrinomonadaceae bacterium]
MPASLMLEFYSRHFDTVEVNNTFYQLPAPKTLDTWRDSSPAGFRFAIKASRFITHMKKLKEPRASTAKFFSRIERLEAKLGPILFQLPPRWQLDLERLARFLEDLPSGHRYVFEFRDESWLVSRVFALLRQHNAAFCIHDLSDMKMPLEITSEFTYVRFHGPGNAKYSGSYSKQDLKKWARRIERWSQSLSAIYVYFNNDVGGWAVKNAAELRKLIHAWG